MINKPKRIDFRYLEDGEEEKPEYLDVPVSQNNFTARGTKGKQWFSILVKEVTNKIFNKIYLYFSFKLWKILVYAALYMCFIIFLYI